MLHFSNTSDKEPFKIAQQNDNVISGLTLQLKRSIAYFMPKPRLEQKGEGNLGVLVILCRLTPVWSTQMHTRYVIALQALNKILGDESAAASHKDEAQKLKLQLLRTLDWQFLEKAEKAAQHVKFPKNYQPF